jgi:hypothetical protein
MHDINFALHIYLSKVVLLLLLPRRLRSLRLRRLTPWTAVWICSAAPAAEETTKSTVVSRQL